MIAEWRGRVGYREALADQRAYRERVIAGEASEALWGLEHDPVITTGRRAAEAGVDPDRVRAAGFDLVETERGGLATCHEPGQLVGYLFVDARVAGVRRTVEAIEDAVIAWMAGEGIPAGRRDGYPGVWVGREKVCAIGLHVRQGITMHGFALNLVNDLRGFGLVTPCGITDGGVTALVRLKKDAPSPEQAWPTLHPLVNSAVLSSKRFART